MCFLFDGCLTPLLKQIFTGFWSKVEADEDWRFSVCTESGRIKLVRESKSGEEEYEIY